MLFFIYILRSILSVKRKLAPRLVVKVLFIYPRGRSRAALGALNRVYIESVAP